MEEELSRYCDADVIDAITLIADFLERSTPLSETAALLRQEVIAKELIPPTTSWTGHIVPGSVPNAKLIKALPRDLLIRSLRINNTSEHPAPSSLISTTVNALAKSSPATAAATTNSAAVLGTAALHLRKLAKMEVDSLIKLREEERRLLRESQSDRGRSVQALAAAIRANKLELIAKLKSISPLLCQISHDNSLSRTLLAQEQIGLSSTASVLSSQQQQERLICSQYRMLKKIQGHRGPAYCLSASHDDWIFTGADDGLVRMWNPKTSSLHCVYRGNRQVVTDIAHTRDLIASAAGDNNAPSTDNTVRIWEIGTARHFASLTQHKKPVQRVQFSPDETLLFSSAEDGACVVWDVDSLRRQAADHQRARTVWMDRERQARIRANTRQQQQQQQQQVAGGGEEYVFTLQDEVQLELDCAVAPLQVDAPLVFPHCKRRTRHHSQRQDEHTGELVTVPLVCMAVHPSGKFVATGCEDAVARVWSVAPPPLHHTGAAAPTLPGLISGDYRDGSAHLLCELCGHTTGFVYHIEFSHRGDRVLTFSDKDGTARIWFWPLGENGTNMFASKPQQIILKAIGAGEVQFGPKRPNLQPMVHAAAFSQWDDLVITSQSIKPSLYEGETGFWDTRICVWDSKTGALLRFMRGHRQQAPIIRMHPELNWLGTSCGADGLILFWDFSTGQELKRIDCISTEGYAAVCDARWCNTNAQQSAVDFVVTDSMNRLCLIGTGEESAASRAAPPDQFLSNELGEIMYHALSLEPMDAVLQIPLHLMRPAPRLTDAFGDVYLHQPPPVERGQGSYFAPSSAVGAERASLKDRIRQAEELAAALKKKEEDARQVAAAEMRKQDDLIALAVEQDMKRAQAIWEQQQQSSASKMQQRSSNRANGSTGTSNNAAGGRRRTEKSAPMLALERAALLQDSGSEEEDEQEEEAQQQTGRKRRRAAVRATRSIHRHTRHMVDLAASSEGATGRNRETAAAASQWLHGMDDDDHVVQEDELSEGEESSVDEYGERKFIVDDDDEEEELAELVDEQYSAGEDEDDDDSPEKQQHRRQRRYKTRGKRTDYSRFYDGRPTEETPMEVANEPAAAATAPVPQKQQQHAALHKPFNDDWLTSSSETLAHFVPQRGDEVVYFPQGHIDYLNRFPSSLSPPWHAWNTQEWPYVLCEVEDVDYSFPNPEQQAANIQHILCRVKLSVIKVKSEPGAREFFTELGPGNEIRFTLEFHPAGPEFLVLHQRFLYAMQPKFQPGTAVHCFYANEVGELVSYEAEVVAVVERDPQSWPESPWDAIECRFPATGTSTNGAETTGYFSPWDVEPIQPSADTMTTTTTSTTTTSVSKVSPETLAFWSETMPGTDLPCGQWIHAEIQSCPLPLFALSKRKMSKCPCDLSIGLVCERLLNGKYYRQWAAIEADLEKAVEYATVGSRDASKARDMLLEFKEICEIARGTPRTPQAGEYVDWDEFKSAVLGALERTARADKENFFAEPVDVRQVPDYLDFISKPMDFGTIRTRIETDWEERERVSFTEARQLVRNVVAAIKLMSLNAMVYNADTSLVFRRAKEVVKRMTTEFSELKSTVLVVREEKEEEEEEEQARGAGEDEYDGIGELTSEEETVVIKSTRSRRAAARSGGGAWAEEGGGGRRSTRTRSRRGAASDADLVELSDEEDEEEEDDEVFEEEEDEEEEVRAPRRGRAAAVPAKKRPKTAPPSPASESEEEEQHGLRRSTRATRQVVSYDEPRSTPKPLLLSRGSRSRPNKQLEAKQELTPVWPSRRGGGGAKPVEQPEPGRRSTRATRLVEEPAEARRRSSIPSEESSEEEVIPVQRTGLNRRASKSKPLESNVTTTRSRRASIASAAASEEEEELQVPKRPLRSKRVSRAAEEEEEEQVVATTTTRSRRAKALEAASIPPKKRSKLEEEEEAPVRRTTRSRVSKPQAEEEDDDDEEEAPVRRTTRSRVSKPQTEEEDDDDEEEAPVRRTTRSRVSKPQAEEEEVIPKRRSRRSSITVEDAPSPPPTRRRASSSVAAARVTKEKPHQQRRAKRQRDSSSEEEEAEVSEEEESMFSEQESEFSEHEEEDE